MTIPRATMRIQFHSGFNFKDAARIVPYLAALGVSHLYASPIMKAREGSMHGYDVVDPTVINPELGGEAEFRALVSALRHAGLGIIVDIVPNHMAVGSDNAWWLDVLQYGERSRFARYFDIDWEPGDPALWGKVLVPVLGRPYGLALQNGEITLAYNPVAQRFEVRYFHEIFPIHLNDSGEIERLSVSGFDAATQEGRERLHALLERQHFRLAWWRSANDSINWRRFFDVNELIALRVEDEEVFEATHATLFRLYAEGLVDGVRVDHIDGLTDPRQYCGRLRARFSALATQRPPHLPAEQTYVVVEKILGASEQLPVDWDCDGTSGYDFMDHVSRVLHDGDGAQPLSQLWERLSGRTADFRTEEEAARRDILVRSFSAQLASVVGVLHVLARSDLATRDISKAAIRRVLTEILAHMRVYRTYANGSEVSAADSARFNPALAAARRTVLRADRVVLNEIAKWLGGGVPLPGREKQQRDAIRRFAQLSSPLAAKAVEDTAFYRYGRLLSRTDVGFDPLSFSENAEAFHRQSMERAARFPHAMLATATHDHKRGEDVRARLAVLSEIPDAWSTTLDSWLAETSSLREMVEGEPAPSLADAAILFQMIVGAWPTELSSADRPACAAFVGRLAAWQQKALREAKLKTEWTAPNEPYEAAARGFLERVMAPERAARIAMFVTSIAGPGAVNSLAQTLLKLTVPGLPDVYQGCELWDFSLVDPDNRRPVDFELRSKLLHRSADVSQLVAAWPDGGIKQHIIRTALATRRSAPDLFAKGAYEPLRAVGENAGHILTFARRWRGCIAVTVVCLRVARWLKNGALTLPLNRVDGIELCIPKELNGIRFDNVLTATSVLAKNGRLELSGVLGCLPIALLVGSVRSV